ADDKPPQPADAPQKTPDPATAPATATPVATQAKVTAQVMFKSIQEARADIQGLATRLEAIEKILGIMSEKIGPLHANVTNMQKSQDSHYKEFSTSFAKVCGNMRSNFDESQQLARENYHNLEQRLGSVENRLVGGIQKTLEKITNCDYQTNQNLDKKIDSLGSEVLAALHFVQSELAEAKQSASTTSEEVRSIREMCERPMPAAAPQYRAPHFAAPLPGPAPSYEAAVPARSLSLQNAIPAEPSITISPDGRKMEFMTHVVRVLSCTLLHVRLDQFPEATAEDRSFVDYLFTDITCRFDASSECLIWEHFGLHLPTWQILLRPARIEGLYE
ncbi:unnamed protein product, partial [Symbiodinium sp. KB8]